MNAPTVNNCPTCGRTLGSAGAPGACHTTPNVIPAANGGIKYAPRTDTCAACGGPPHRKLHRAERDLICAWNQFGQSQGYGARHDLTPLSAMEFAQWMAGSTMIAAPRRQKRAAAPKNAAPCVIPGCVDLYGHAGPSHRFSCGCETDGVLVDPCSQHAPAPPPVPLVEPPADCPWANDHAQPCYCGKDVIPSVDPLADLFSDDDLADTFAPPPALVAAAASNSLFDDD